jgi:hypothetical protein
MEPKPRSFRLVPVSEEITLGIVDKADAIPRQRGGKLPDRLRHRVRQ